MRYLGLGLFAEGRTDYRFLPAVLWKLAFDLCCRGTSDEVEIPSIQVLTYPEEYRRQDRPSQMLGAVSDAWPGIDILFVHVDGGGDAEAAWQNNAQPGVELIERELGLGQRRIVSVIPIREMEAWALADGEALRTVFGTTLSNAQLGLPGRLREVEALPDPKTTLEEAYRRVVGQVKPRRRPATFLDAIGLQIRLTRLRQIPSFLRMEKRFQQALLDLRYLEHELV